LNVQLGGTTLDRFIAFGSAASRGASLEVDTIKFEEAEQIVSSTTDLLDEAKSSLNYPVASEMLAQRQTQYAPMLTRSFENFWHMYRISLRNWLKSLFLDLLSGSQAAPLELSKHRLG
jgi:hypothetical protein